MSPITTDAPPSDEEVYDFVIVGSGAGGGPLAANLAKAGHSVLVLEAGDAHRCTYYDAPIMQAYAAEDPDMAWNFFVHHHDDPTQARRDPKFTDAHDGVFYPRGSSLGGSTAVNAMIAIYPHDRDWTRLAELTGDASWGPEQMRRRFQELEAWQGVDVQPLPGEDTATRDAKAKRGHDGWLTTTRAAPEIAGREPFFLDIINAIEKTSRQLFPIPDDVSLPRDPNADDTPDDYEGMAYIPVAVRDGVRNGTRELLTQTASEGGNLTVRLNSLATRVLFDDDNRATGVEYLHGPRLYQAASPESCGAGASSSDRPAQGKNAPAGSSDASVHGDPVQTVPVSSTEPQRHTVRARHEVILAGGTYNTPQLLKLSGIGPRGELQRWGIPVRSALEGVGENLHDRYEVAVVSELTENFGLFEGSTLDVPEDLEVGDPLYNEWRDDKTGPYTTNGSLAALVARSSVADDGASDLLIFALPIDFHGYYPGYAKDGSVAHNRVSVLVLKADTKNRAGSVNLRSADPRQVPEIHFRYFGEGTPDAANQDLRGVADGMRIARQVVANLSEAKVAREVIPGSDVETDEQLQTFIRDEAWGHHACGTAKIGRDDDPMAVLDGDFRVRGVQNLRVVDASVFPDIPGYFIVSAVYLISAKASAVIITQYTN